MAAERKMSACKHCGAEIAANAKVCPRCGGKNKRPLYKRPWFLVLAALLALAIVGNLGGQSQDPAPEEDAGTLTSVTLIFVAVVLSGVGIFDRIAKVAGAGTLVPITGFANSVVSPAIDSHSEGLILGVGAKIFTVSGPVLLYGTLAGSIYGVILWIVSRFVEGVL